MLCCQEATLSLSCNKIIYIDKFTSRADVGKINLENAVKPIILGILVSGCLCVILIVY
jgi:hypothetical protein